MPEVVMALSQHVAELVVENLVMQGPSEVPVNSPFPCPGVTGATAELTLKGLVIVHGNDTIRVPRRNLAPELLSRIQQAKG